MTQEQYSGILRHVLTVVAGIAVNQGYLDSDAGTAIVGGIVAAFTVLWSIRSNKKVQP